MTFIWLLQKLGLYLTFSDISHSLDKGIPMSFADSKRLTTVGAKNMLAAAVAKAEEIGIAATVAIVDAGGHLICLERMDGGKFHTIHSSTTKAVSASSNKRLTTSQGSVGQDLDTLHALGLALAAGPERWTAMEGGFPIIVDGECVGGIGVSGGDWAQDQDMAKAAGAAVGVAM
jgi:glc operon protein GlcG